MRDILAPNQDFFLMLGGLEKRLPRGMLFSLSDSDCLCCLHPSDFTVRIGRGAWKEGWEVGVGWVGGHPPALVKSKFSTLPFTSLGGVGAQALSRESRFEFKFQLDSNWVTWASPFPSLSLSYKMTGGVGGRFSGYFLTS